MPSPGAGSVTSLSYMAQFLRSKSNSPSQGYSAGAEQRDVTQYQETFHARSSDPATRWDSEVTEPASGDSLINILRVDAVFAAPFDAADRVIYLCGLPPRLLPLHRFVAQPLDIAVVLAHLDEQVGQGPDQRIDAVR